MSMHTDLMIYRTSGELLALLIKHAKELRRDVKPLVAAQWISDCLAVVNLIRMANDPSDSDENRAVHLVNVGGRLDAINTLARATRDAGVLSIDKYAAIVKVTASVGKQATGWRKYLSPPDASRSRPR